MRDKRTSVAFPLEGKDLRLAEWMRGKRTSLAFP